MKDRRFLAVGLFVIAATLSGCNRSIVDTHWSYEYAQIAMLDGTVIEGKISSWTDFDDGDQLQVTIDGKTYLTHSCNVVLIDE